MLVLGVRGPARSPRTAAANARALYRAACARAVREERLKTHDAGSESSAEPISRSPRCSAGLRNGRKLPSGPTSRRARKSADGGPAETVVRRHLSAPAPSRSSAIAGAPSRRALPERAAMDANWDEMFTELPDKLVKGKKGKAVFWYESDNALTSFEKYQIKQQRLRDVEARRIESIHARDQQRWIDGQKFARRAPRCARPLAERLLKKDFKDWSPALRAEYERKRSGRGPRRSPAAQRARLECAQRDPHDRAPDRDEQPPGRVPHAAHATDRGGVRFGAARARGGVSELARGSDARARQSRARARHARGAARGPCAAVFSLSGTFSPRRSARRARRTPPRGPTPSRTSSPRRRARATS